MKTTTSRNTRTGTARTATARKPLRSTKVTKVAGTRGLTRKRDIFTAQRGTSGVRQSGRSATSAIP